MNTAEYRKLLGLPAQESGKMSSVDYLKLINKEKRVNTKYGNKKTEVDGILFDSKFEADYYQELKLLEKMGIITELKRQHPFILLDSYVYDSKKVQPIIYKADFTFYEKNAQQVKTSDIKLVVVDTKGYETYVFKMKKKMLLSRYGHAIDFRVIKKIINRGYNE